MSVITNFAKYDHVILMIDTTMSVEHKNQLRQKRYRVIEAMEPNNVITKLEAKEILRLTISNPSRRLTFAPSEWNSFSTV